LIGAVIVRIVQFRVLGPVEVHIDDGRVLTLPRRHERCLLGVLLLEAGRIVTVSRLCGLLWEDPPPRAAHSLRTYAARIRALLAQARTTDDDPVALISDHSGYRLDVRADRVDAHQFRQLLAQADALDDPARRDQLFRRALSLWRGQPLHCAVRDEVREQLCADLEELHLQALERSIATGLELGHYDELLPELARLRAEHPLRERLAALQMTALYRSGRVPDALQVYQRIRADLADQVGLDPGPELGQLHQGILRGDEAPGRPVVFSGVRDHPPAPPAQLPAAIAEFVGRSEHLLYLDTALTRASTSIVICAISGTAGVGKTALAIHWAHRVADRFPDGQLYVNLRGYDPSGQIVSPIEAIRSFLDALGVPAEGVPRHPDAQAALYRTLLSDKKVLLVLDNARDAEQVRPLLPGTPSSVAVVTSRQQLAGLVATHHARPVTLGLFDADEARELLTGRTGTGRLADEPGAVDEVIRCCARLPLALAIVAARAATQPQLSASILAAQLHAARSTLDVLAADDVATDVRGVFSWSYQTLSRPAARVFRQLGLHPGPDMSVPAAASLAAVAPADVRPVLDQLVRANLISEPVPGRYVLHELMQAYAAEQADGIDPATDRLAARQRLIDHYLHASWDAVRQLEPQRALIALSPPAKSSCAVQIADRGEALAWFTTEQAVLATMVDYAITAGLDRHAWQLASALTTFLDRRAQPYDLARTQQTALAAAERLSDLSAQAYSHRHLARAYASMGDLDEGHTRMLRALELYRQAGDPVGQAQTHLSLAFVLERQVRCTEAMQHCRQGLELYQTVDDKRGQANALNGIGWYHTLLGDYAEGLRFCRLSLALHRESGSLSGAAAVLDSIGYTYQGLGRYTDAVTAYQQAIELFRELGDRWLEADTLHHLGNAHHANDRRDAARDAWRAALAILTDLGRPAAAEVQRKLDAG
jgi:DNA-binding SARP family transcriptional activator/tetratricopeptide (TPR) repeat protein